MPGIAIVGGTGPFGRYHRRAEWMFGTTRDAKAGTLSRLDATGENVAAATVGRIHR